MSLSKPSKLIYTLVGAYYEGLYNNPIKTKSLTSCAVAMMANLTAQYMSGASSLDQDALVAFGLFGILFGGTVPHYFYQTLEHIVPETSARYFFKQLLIERLIFTPLYQGFVIYTLARLEGKSHREAAAQLGTLYWPLLQANWTFISLLQALNLRFVPPILRVLVNNLIGYVWAVFVAHKKRKADAKPNRRRD